MLINKKTSSQKKIIQAGLIGVCLFGAGYLLFTNFISPSLAPAGGTDTGLAGPQVFVPVSLKTNLKTDYLTKPPFVELRPYAVLPVQVKPEELGNQRPFLKAQ